MKKVLIWHPKVILDLDLDLFNFRNIKLHGFIQKTEKVLIKGYLQKQKYKN